MIKKVTFKLERFLKNVKMRVVVILIILISNFSFAQESQDNCLENLRFKKYFFKNISVINEYRNVGEKCVSKALDQINLYVEVGDFEILGYGGVSYNSDEICKELIAKYVEWYELNKCRDLKKFKRKFHRNNYKPIR